MQTMEIKGREVQTRFIVVRYTLTYDYSPRSISWVLQMIFKDLENPSLGLIFNVYKDIDPMDKRGMLRL